MTNLAYCGGRFPVPPAFDFVLLPLKTKKVSVISVIGSWDYFNQKSCTQFIENFLGKNVFSLPCAESILQGYYDCERQIIFLHFRDSEHILDELLVNSKNSEQILNEWESERLKYLYYLFLVSHFILIINYGTNLDTRYISLFKLVNRLRVKLRHSVEALLRTLPLPRYCIASGRVGTPRLLFVFKLPPTIEARKLFENENTLLALEKNLVGQIFNVFYESGLLEGNSSENRLFDLMGYSYVCVLYPDVIESLDLLTEDPDRDDLAQNLLENLVEAVDPEALSDCDRSRSTVASTPNLLYPPPDRPDDRSFAAFLQCQITNLLDDPNFRGQSDCHSHFVFELPTCKAWFIACYKLYTSLMSDQEPGSGRSQRAAAASTMQADSSSDTSGSNLAKCWQALFATASSTGTNTTGLSGVDSLNLAPTFATRLMLEHQLSEISCESALSVAEAQYRHDLPAHYSRTYHLARVISAYNVVLSLARGPAVLPCLDRLTRRLARLYLAGQVGCSARSTSGALCRQELHRLPERFPGIVVALDALRQRPKQNAASSDETSAASDAVLASRIASATEMEDIQTAARRIYISAGRGYQHIPRFEDAISETSMEIPTALTGVWRCLWVLTVLKLLESASETKSEEFSKIRVDGTAQINTQPEVASSDQSTMHLAVIPHRSDVKFVSSCNCGRLQAQRPDPFDYREANWEFYNSLAANCCSKLDACALAPDFLNSTGHHFVPSTIDRNIQGAGAFSADDTENALPPDSTRTTVMEPDREVAIVEPVDLGQRDENCFEPLSEEGDETIADTDLVDVFFNAHDEFPSENELSSDSSAAAFDRSMLSRTDDEAETAGAASQDSETAFVTPRGYDHVATSHDSSQSESEGVRTSPKRQLQLVLKIPVTFVDTMPTLNLPLGHFPLYSSWAVHALGKYFSYSHSSGFSYPGFLRGSNFLLPWDVQLSRSLTSTAWQNTSERGNRSGRGKGRQRDVDAIKLFIGFEMECSLGHRFFLAGPERAMIGLMQGCDVRRAVSSLLSRDLPIYMPCRCSKAGASADRRYTDTTECSTGEADSSIVWAQLMRVFIALPAAPVRIRFQPRIRPGPLETHTPIFHLGPTLDQQLDMDNPENSKIVHGNPPVDYVGSNESLSDSSEAMGKNTGSVRPLSSARKSGPQPGYLYLDNGYLWVIRLPFVYQSGSNLYRRPKNPQLIEECCLLGGSITLEEL